MLYCLLQLADYSYPPPQSNNFRPLPSAPLHNQDSVDTADGWDDEWDDDETVSSYSGGDQESGTISSLPRRDNSSGIVRTGTVRKSMNRYLFFILKYFKIIIINREALIFE